MDAGALNSEKKIDSNAPLDPSEGYDKNFLAENHENFEINKDVLKEAEAEDNTLQNYVDQEQALKDNMQMINYKSKFTYFYS